MSKSFYYIANWKMNMHFHKAVTFCTSEYDELLELTRTPENHIVLCPSFPALFSIAQMFKQSRIAIGAQDCSAHTYGAFTGEVSAQSLHEAGTRFCIIGHSERRTHNHETNDIVVQKMIQLYTHKIIPIVCVGETHQIYTAQKTLPHLQEQLAGLHKALQTMRTDLFPYKLYIAYEPIWAIGTGLIPDPAHIQTVNFFIQEYFKDLFGKISLTILYGGSVHPDNILQLKSVSNVDGFLIGGASTDFQTLKKIVLSN